MQKKQFTTEIGGKTLTAEFTDIAERANGSVFIRYGNTLILATAVMSREVKEGVNFFPLTVEYEEKFYATGQILGSRSVRREGKLSDEAILSGRIIDRTIRPLFEQWMRREVQIIISVLSIDEDSPDILAVLGASLALSTSDIPWNGPVSAVRIGKMKQADDARSDVSDTLAINPTYAWRRQTEVEFEMVACGKDGKINMIEFGGNESSEADAMKALQAASQEIEKIQEFQKKVTAEMVKISGRQKQIIIKPETPELLSRLFSEKIAPKLKATIFTNISGDANIKELADEWGKLAKDALATANMAWNNHASSQTEEIFEESINALIHNEAIDKGRRADGRGFDDIRPLYAQAGGISPILHGSGIFYRGQTHILSALTLAGLQDAQLVDTVEGGQTGIKAEDKRFIHHYNFPPFSTGETGRNAGPNRRMIGHGALAEKALAPMIPPKEQFPYTIRIVSEALSSDGSTSMGSVCASTLALMDAGVPIKRPVAGISCGLMMRGDSYKVLTDIQGPEDHYGDMDFKVAGTHEGITAIQMDVKVDGIPLGIFPEAFEKARAARMKILDIIRQTISAPRQNISPNAPKIIMIKIKKDRIGLIIGPGGKTINTIKDKTGVQEINIEDDGTVFISGKNGNAEKAADVISKMIETADVVHPPAPSA